MASAMTSGDMPSPVSRTLTWTYVAGGDLLRPEGIAADGGQGPRQFCIGALDLQPAPFRHGIAGIDREIENRRFQLPRVDLQRPEPRTELHVELDLLAQDAFEKAFELGQRQGEIHGLRPQRVAPREGQQLARQPFAILNRLAAAADQLHELVHDQGGGLAKVHLHQAEVGDDHRQQIVEIMGDAARQVADGLHLLGLQQRLFRLPALGDLRHQLLVGVRELPRPLGDPLLQLLDRPRAVRSARPMRRSAYRATSSSGSIGSTR